MVIVIIVKSILSCESRKSAFLREELVEMVSVHEFDKNQDVTILAWNIPILYMVFTQKIRNFVVLVFIRPVKKTYNAEFISQICMEHILRRLRYNHTDNANH